MTGFHAFDLPALDGSPNVLGPLAGKVTLAVNVGVMALALYALLIYMSWGLPPEADLVWDAPILDLALLRVIHGREPASRN